MTGLAVIMGFWLLGESIALLFRLPFPGTVLGLVLLWFALARGWIKPEVIERFAGFLLDNLTLFFVPVVVGVIAYIEVFSRYWFAISLSLVVSTICGLVAAGRAAELFGETNSDC
ncbi:MAG: CidA/LrgA family protein [Firmicutes bacterium]|nr:CidA/LrgA family protein [Bacillota bacterium]